MKTINIGFHSQADILNQISKFICEKPFKRVRRPRSFSQSVYLTLARLLMKPLNGQCLLKMNPYFVLSVPEDC